MVNTKFPTVNSVRARRGGRDADLTVAAGRDNLAHLTIRADNVNRTQARDTARELLEIVPLVMRTVAAELRSAGELPAPAHFGLLMVLSERGRTLTELAALRGVSLPTMSNSVTALVQRGWIRRSGPGKDRRTMILEVTTSGRGALDRVGRCAELHLSEVLAPLDAAGRRRLIGGLGVLRKLFAVPPDTAAGRRRRAARERD
jgi:DNA-binding MarR family transcriptional regulator